MNSAATIIRRDPSEKRYPYHKVFLGGALLYFLAVLPFLIYHGGIFFYYGDYNVQQVPFYILAHRAVRSGNFFWSFKVDLGSPMAGSFAFYLWGSPFFWLSCLFPEKWVPYLTPALMMLKYGSSPSTSSSSTFTTPCASSRSIFSPWSSSCGLSAGESARTFSGTASFLSA